MNKKWKKSVGPEEEEEEEPEEEQPAGAVCVSLILKDGNYLIPTELHYSMQYNVYF